MESWGHLAVAVAAAAVGAWLAWDSRQRPAWAFASLYAAGLVLVGAWALNARLPVLAAGCLPELLVSGPDRFAVAALGALLVLATPCMRLRPERRRLPLLALASVLALLVGVVPVVSAARAATRLAALEDAWFADGVCRQQTDYTCGPAAAATGLRLVGLRTTEREVALLARTSPADGTPPGVLLGALRQRFTGQGLNADLVRFADLATLGKAGPALVLVRMGSWVDHWVCVREVTAGHVVVGDPLAGWQRRSHDEFLAEWRRVGIVLRRTGGRGPDKGR